MDFFKRILVLGDRQTGKSQFVNEHKKEKSLVIDDIDYNLINSKMEDFLSDAYEQSIIIMQYPYKNEQLINNIDCIIFFNLSEILYNELQSTFNISQDIIEHVKNLKKFEYLIYDYKSFKKM